MNVAGSAILLVAVGLLVLVGAVAVNDLHQEAMSTNDTNIQQQASASAAIEKPLFIVFQYFTNWIRKSSIPITISNI